MEVNDSLSWNNHIWVLSVKNGVVSLEKSDKEIPEVIVDIQTLTKAMFGYQSLSDSFKIGNVLGNTDEIETLDKLFVHKKAQLKDFF
ncbi:sterol carrier protein domain-containing protein [Companilactobacillus huachuanensis]|uniref:Sterol carrier protein domain-containing protein n=1 Tax=Companilactobacillus huachuanensis TaxID=2559914 RepID=A0ABW1RNU5_9LACO|nr:sterol carrier protein domain-containing protein [Companilactobacillus huachuanensis]